LAYSKQDYEKLLSQYNMLVAKYKDLSEQMRIKLDQWGQYEAAHDIIEKHARELCEMILAKDKAEMVLGTNRTWNTFTTDEMILKAKDGFVKYAKDRTAVLNQVMAIAEERGRKIESMMDQISHVMHSGNIASTTAEDLLAQAEESQKKKETLEKASYATQKAAAAGSVQVIIEEDGDCDESETEALAKMMGVAEQVKLTESCAGIARGKKKQNIIDVANKKAQELYFADLDETMSKMNEMDWEMLGLIGRTGLSRYTEIKDTLKHDLGTTDSTLARAATNLYTLGALEKQTLTLPLSKNAVFYKLSFAGIRMYQHHFGTDPVIAEIDKVNKEHDNPAHGYGILDLEKVLRESNRYKEISTFNRGQAFDVDVGGKMCKYIPDLICKADRFTDYFEYECGTHHQQDFDNKLSKMCRVTRFLHIVTPNKPTAQKIKAQVDTWIEGRGVQSLQRIVVKIGTAQSVKNDGKWLVVYELQKGPVPTQDLISGS
jgi:hypothetical protein